MGVEQAVEALRMHDHVLAEAESVLCRTDLGPLLKGLLDVRAMAVRGPRPDYRPCLCVVWDVPDSETPGGRAKFRALAELEGGGELEVVTLLRRLLVNILAHELDEFITVGGRRPFAPHPLGERSPFILDWMPDPSSPVLTDMVAVAQR